MKLSQKVINKLGYYVYVYSDPDNNIPFYIGKGKGDRVFSHLTDDKDSKKVEKIKQLASVGKQPKIEILAHGLKDDETAQKVEAACIDLIGIENLTNMQRGYGSSQYGKIDVSQLENKYNIKPLLYKDIAEDVLIIKVNKSYHHDMTTAEIYEITRSWWRLDANKLENIKYVLSVYYGLVLEVFEVAGWFPAGTTINSKIFPDDKMKGKREFVGKVAPDKIRSKYIGKTIIEELKPGDRNPIRYIEHKSN